MYILVGIFGMFLLFVSIPIYVVNDCHILPWPVSTKLGLPWKKIPCSYHGFMWGKSVIEYSADVKCLIDKQGFCFFFGSCTATACTPKVENTTQKTTIQQLIQKGCISYFDGCNTCTIDRITAHSMCTLMACSTVQEPTCTQYR